MNEYKKTALCLGGNGFICHHMARRLKSEGYWVRVVDLEPYNYGVNDYADEIIIGDLRDKDFVESVIRLNENYEHSFLPMPYEKECEFTYIFQMAADMGGSLYVFSGDHDADIMQNSAMVNLNVLQVCADTNYKGKIFYSSSACMYPMFIQEEIGNTGLKESDWFPSGPDSEYGWEKLFSERLYLAYQRNYGLNVRIARFHNIYGPEGTYQGGKEKAPAAMCRKVCSVANTIDPQFTYPSIEVWGDGQQTRSFLYIDDCIDAVRLLMQSDFKEPINIGSEEMVSINQLAQMAIDISGKPIQIKNVPSNALGVRGRNSDNTLIRQVLRWEPKWSLKLGLEVTYKWINQQINGK